MVRVVLVEDVERSLNVLTNILQEYCDGLEIVGVAKNVSEGISVIGGTQPDLVFMDIELQDGTGFDILEGFPDPRFEVIFTTAYDQYAIRAFKFSAVDYLLKPLNIQEVQDAFARYMKRHKSAASELAIQRRMDQFSMLLENMQAKTKEIEQLAIPSIDGYEFIQLSELIWVQASNNYTVFYMLEGRQIISSRNLKEYNELLPISQFYRIHHSHIINIKFVKKYIKGKHAQVVMSDGTILDIAQRRKDGFVKTYNLR